jgi:chromosome segregation ATPase
MNPSTDVPGAAEADPFTTPRANTTATPLLESLRRSQREFSMSSATTRVMRTGEKRPGDPLMDTPERVTNQFRQLRRTVDSQDDLLTAILKKSSAMEEIVRSLHDKVVGLESATPAALREISRAIDEKMARIETAVAQASHNDSIRALHDKIAGLEAAVAETAPRDAVFRDTISALHDKIVTMEATLNNHMEKSAKFDALCSKFEGMGSLPTAQTGAPEPILHEIAQILKTTNDTRAQVDLMMTGLENEKMANDARWHALQQSRGEAVMGRGAGGAAPPPEAPQPRIGSEKGGIAG